MEAFAGYTKQSHSCRIKPAPLYINKIHTSTNEPPNDQRLRQITIANINQQRDKQQRRYSKN